MPRARLAVVLAVPALLCAACGGGGGGSEPPVERRQQPGPVVTPRGIAMEPGVAGTVVGGSLTSSDGRLTLTVPAGALPDAQTIVTIQRITSFAPGGKGAAYRLLPNGLTFSSPASVTFRPSASDLRTVALDALGVAYQTAEGTWSWIRQANRNGGAGTVSVPVSHFTDFAGVSPVLLRPLAATVPLNGTLALEVVACFEPETTTTPLAPLLAWDCGNGIAPLVAVRNWSVNATAGGSAAIGTVTGSGLSATYHAPAAKPVPNTVAVTVQTDAATGRPATTLFSLVTIDKPGPFTGRIDATGTFMAMYPMTISVPDATLTVRTLQNGQPDDGPDMTLYDLTGHLTLPSSIDAGGGIVCTPAVTSKAIANTVVNVRKDPPTMWFALSDSFPASCTVLGNTTIFVQWGTYVPGCASTPLLVEVPIPDSVHPEGGYATDCTISRAAGTWSFAP